MATPMVRRRQSYVISAGRRGGAKRTGRGRIIASACKSKQSNPCSAATRATSAATSVADQINGMTAVSLHAHAESGATAQGSTSGSL